MWKLWEAFRSCVSSDKIPISFPRLTVIRGGFVYVCVCVLLFASLFLPFSPTHSLAQSLVYKSRPDLMFLCNLYTKHSITFTFSNGSLVPAFATKIFQISEFAITTGCIHFALWAPDFVSRTLLFPLFHFFLFFFNGCCCCCCRFFLVILSLLENPT